MLASLFEESFCCIEEAEVVHDEEAAAKRPSMSVSLGLDLVLLVLVLVVLLLRLSRELLELEVWESKRRGIDCGDNIGTLAVVGGQERRLVLGFTGSRSTRNAKAEGCWCPDEMAVVMLLQLLLVLSVLPVLQFQLEEDASSEVSQGESVARRSRCDETIQVMILVAGKYEA